MGCVEIFVHCFFRYNKNILVTRKPCEVLKLKSDINSMTSLLVFLKVNISTPFFRTCSKDVRELQSYYVFLQKVFLYFRLYSYNISFNWPNTRKKIVPQKFYNLSSKLVLQCTINADKVKQTENSKKKNWSIVWGHTKPLTVLKN